MKSKKIVALALIAAMAVSASMTAFAARPSKKSDIVSYKTTEEKDGDTVKSKKQVEYTQIVVKCVKSGETSQEGGLAYYQIDKADEGSVPDAITTEGTIPVSQYKFKDAQKTDFASVDIGTVKVSDVKGLPSSTAAPAGKVFVGWSTENATAQATNAKVTAGKYDEYVNDQKDVNLLTLMDTEAAEGKVKGTETDPVVLYPVFRNKNDAEKNQEILEEAAADKVAATKDGKAIGSGAKEFSAKLVKVAANKVSGLTKTEDDLKAANADASKSQVWEIHPYVEDGDKQVEVKMINGATVKVEVTHKLDDKKLRIFHIQDGKAYEIKDFTSKDGKATFQYGNFSDFVFTTDENAKGAGEASSTPAATSTEVATSTSTSTGTEDTAADGGNVPTGEFSALPVALLAVAALSATGVVAYKKRIAE